MMHLPPEGAGKVTAGLPGLSPFSRHRREVVERTRALSTSELLAELERESATVADDGGVDTTNIVAQLGRPLLTTDVEARLRKMNANLIFERSISDSTKAGIYVADRTRDHLNQSYRTVKRFVVGMEAAYQPEFSVRHFTTKRIPDPTIPGHWREVKAFDSETRGWRTVLARLLRERLITGPQIEKYFDVTAASRTSENWQTLTT